LVACSSGGSDNGAGKVVDEKSVPVVAVTQTVILGAGTPYATSVSVPPGASADGRQIRITLKSGVNFGTYTSDAAIEVGPSDIVINQPLRARRSVAIAPVRRRYISVQNDPATNTSVARGGARRIYDPLVPSDGQSELWEADLDAAGVWGVALDPAPLGTTDDGTQLEDSMPYFETEQVQKLLVGPPTARRVLTIAAAEPGTPAFLGPVVAPKVGMNNPLIFDPSVDLVVQSQTAARMRSPAIADVVTVPQPTAGRTRTPVPVTAVRLRRPGALTVLSGRGRYVTVTEPLTGRSRLAPGTSEPPLPVVVRSGTAAGVWEEPVPPVPVVPSTTVVPPTPATTQTVDITQPVDNMWYGIGVAPGTSPTDGGVPDGGAVAPAPDGGVVTPVPDGGVAPDADVVVGALVAQPASVQLAGSTWNVLSAATRVTIRNSGGQSSGNITFAFMGTDAARFSITATTCTAPLAAGETCTLDVAFTPKEPRELKATLVVTGASAGATSIPVSGLGMASQLEVNESVHDFGSVKLNQESATTVFIYKNTGNVATGSLVYQGGTQASNDYGITNGCVGADLPPGGTCTISVSFKPTILGDRTNEIYFEIGASGPVGKTKWIGTGIP